MKQTTSNQASLLLRIFGLAGIGSGLIAAIPGIVELAAPMIVGYPDKPAFIASTAQTQLTIIGFLHLFKSLGFLSFLYGVFFTATKRGRGLQIMLVVATVGALWYGGYWI